MPAQRLLGGRGTTRPGEDTGWSLGCSVRDQVPACGPGSRPGRGLWSDRILVSSGPASDCPPQREGHMASEPRGVFLQSALATALLVCDGRSCLLTDIPGSNVFVRSDVNWCPTNFIHSYS